MRAYKFLRDDCRSGSGDEGPWSEGETRVHQGPLVICASGYHTSPTWLDALAYALGSNAMVAEVSADGVAQTDKRVSRSCTAVKIRNVARELRLFACECAERALAREEAEGRRVDPRSREAIEVARRFAVGEATDDELAAAGAAARDAAWAAGAAAGAAWAAAWAAGDAWAAAGAAGAAARAAWAAAGDAAWAAAWAASRAAGDAEIIWQRARLAELIDGAMELAS